MTSYYKTVKTNTLLILKEKGQPMTKKEVVADYLSRDNCPEHTLDKKLYNNISQALNKFKKQGYISSPARATYEIKEAYSQSYKDLVDSNKDLVSTTFVSHSPVTEEPAPEEVGYVEIPEEVTLEEAPAEDVAEVTIPEEVSIEEEVIYVEIPDPIIEDPFYLEEEEYQLPECVYSPLSVEVTLTNGKRLVGKYEVARHEDNLLVKAGGLVAVIPMCDSLRGGSEHEAINTFVEKVTEDFQHAPSDVYGAERFCKVLTVCVDAHKHDSPLGGLVDDCQDSHCPIHSVWNRIVKVV